MDHYLTVQALVIGKKNIRDSDLLITLLTKNNGKIKAVAKGVKNIKSSRLSALQLGNLVTASLYQNNSYYWISETVCLDPFLAKSKNLTQINLLFYFLEIINNFVAENQQVDDIFEKSKNLIKSINENHIATFINNEIDLLSCFGFGIPDEINVCSKNHDYKTAQKLIKQFTESIIEKPLISNKLFK